jgi:uncharacterized protein DUF4333
VIRRWALLMVLPATMLLAGCTVVIESPGSSPAPPSSTVSSPSVDEPPAGGMDATTLDQGVQGILENDYKVDVESVNCPPDEPAEVGNVFDCDATIDGAVKRVSVTIKSTSGLYEVSQPH